MVRVTDFNRPKRTYDKEDSVKRPLPSQQSAYQSQRATPNPRSEARRLKRKAIREADKECFVCRQKGHLSQDCPKASQNGAISNKTNICYRCGAIDHTLKQCKKTPMRKRKRADEEESESEVIEQEFLPFASCYICQQTGHLVESCPENVRGIYPNGGGCKLCGKCTLLGVADDRRHGSPQEQMSAKGSH